MNEKAEEAWEKYCNPAQIRYVNKYVKTTWYHGTTLAGLESIKELDVLVNYNIGNELDFGPGFYLTHCKHQASSFIQNTIKYKKETDYVLDNINLPKGIKLNKSDGNEYVPVLLEFEFDAKVIIADENLDTKFFCEFNDEFADFVIMNRTENVLLESPHGYDMIIGIQSDSRPSILIEQFENGEIELEELMDELKLPNSRRQISIHNQELCSRLNMVRALNLQTEEELNIDDYIRRRNH